MAVALGRARRRRGEDPRAPIPSHGDLGPLRERGVSATELAQVARRRNLWGCPVRPPWAMAARSGG
eukprot:12780497-Alexandrium_andersonii.AAC.1